ncbi:MAG: S8 family serine peptidase [Bdellovibrionales bacterium]|nr:S8 family serine peptidase [Bdellovibrionales bacterium]
MKVLWGILFGLASICFFSATASAGCPSNRVIKNRYIVGLVDNRYSSYDVDFAQSSLSETLIAAGAKVKVLHDQPRSQNLVYSVDSKMQVPASILSVESEDLDVHSLSQDARVSYVENDCKMDLLAVPNDPRYSSQWGHQQISSESGWDIQTGDAKIIVAISDTGVDYNHPDLKDNMWKNMDELNGTPGVDDDGNGCVDDIYGCDLANNDGDPRPGGEHGTHVAGIVGAVGNNGVGVSGVAWKVRLQASKGFRDGQNSAALSELLASVYYAADNGARVVNCSWGGESTPPQSTKDAFQYAVDKGVVPVVAAGNSTKNASGFSPAGISFVLTVGATGSSNQLATFSNFGSGVDVIAPGGDVQRANIPGSKSEGILSTLPNNQYGELPGTSMASPQVAGLAALVLSRNPNLSVQEVMDIIKNSGDPTDVQASDAGRTAYRYPLINVRKALEMTQPGSGGGNPGNGTPGVCDENPEYCDAAAQGRGVPKIVKDSYAKMGGGCNLKGSGNTKSSGFALAILLLPLGLGIALRRHS